MSIFWSCWHTLIGGYQSIEILMNIYGWNPFFLIVILKNHLPTEDYLWDIAMLSIHFLFRKIYLGNSLQRDICFLCILFSLYHGGEILPKERAAWLWGSPVSFFPFRDRSLALSVVPYWKMFASHILASFVYVLSTEGN